MAHGVIKDDRVMNSEVGPAVVLKGWTMARQDAAVGKVKHIAVIQNQPDLKISLNNPKRIEFQLFIIFGWPIFNPSQNKGCCKDKKRSLVPLKHGISFFQLLAVSLPGKKNNQRSEKGYSDHCNKGHLICIEIIYPDSIF